MINEQFSKNTPGCLAASEQKESLPPQGEMDFSAEGQNPKNQHQRIEVKCAACGAKLLRQRSRVFGKYSAKEAYCDEKCRYSKPAGERLLMHVDKLENGCWVWNRASTHGGYGVMTFNGERIGTHRLSYECFVGPIPAGLHVLHKCDNPPCCNPEHLFLGTPMDNTLDKMRKGRCGIRNLPFGESHKRSKLTDQKVREIRSLYATGKISQKTLCGMFGVTNGSIQPLLLGKTWRHVA